MSEATQHIQHTPGPWEAIPAKNEHGELTISIRGDGQFIATMDTVSVNGSPFRLPPEAAANSRLIVAASNSYSKHCGKRAIEAAEADLLGKALEALRMLRDAGAVPSLSSLPNTDTEIGRAAKAAHEALAAAKEVCGE